ncbi:MAG TPA: molybdopterin synthase sulfur carrier subunit [Deltaproteobacteria bacterium]|nr:molybdopterin synthase sulfur carrier subunit [Deltaproteobacteria bacterium]
MGEVTVIVPVLLRPYTDGASQLTAEGETLGDVFRTLCERFPGLAARLYNENGDFRSFLQVFVESDDIRTRLGMETPVSDGAQITILQALAGG